jgi:carboxypeptidase C (cathepsin A)
MFLGGCYFLGIARCEPRCDLIRQRVALTLAGILFGAVAVADTAPDQAALPKLPVITMHTGTFNGKHTTYEAVVEAIDVNGPDGRPGARLVTISYIAQNADNRANRPVLFAFNGGPISASYVLHMGMLGPKRVAIPDDISADPSTFKIVDNRYTVLDVADIVFFDPASTGFSRTVPGVDPKSYFSVNADGQETAQLIIEWSRLHHRMDSPKYVLGESYGTMRAASVANQIQKLSVPLSGVILVGQALNIIEFSQRPANVISYVASLPTLAAIAWSHGKANLHGQTFDQFMDEVRLFARTDYLTALFQGNKLDPATRDAIAAKLADYTGLPASYYLANSLEISKEKYRRELFKDKHDILGMTDGRYVGRMAASGPTRDPASVISDAYGKAFTDYLRTDLKIADTASYLPAAKGIDGFDAWNYNGTGSSPFADWPFPALLTEVFAANPNFRVMVDNGYEDTQTTVGAAQMLVDRSGWPSDRVILHFYQGGHTAYSIEDTLKRMTDDLRTFIRGQ